MVSWDHWSNWLCLHGSERGFMMRHYFICWFCVSMVIGLPTYLYSHNIIIGQDWKKNRFECSPVHYVLHLYLCIKESLGISIMFHRNVTFTFSIFSLYLLLLICFTYYFHWSMNLIAWILLMFSSSCKFYQNMYKYYFLFLYYKFCCFIYNEFMNK